MKSRAKKNYISKKSKIDNGVELESPVRTYGNVTIKKGSKIGAFTFINVGSRVTSNTHIGRYCSIGRYCEIGAYDHPINWLTSSPFAYNVKGHFPDYEGVVNNFRADRPTATTIGHDVWIGSNVIIKRGVNIGHGAIIAGGAVVTKDVPAYTIVGGLPAKFIRNRFSESISKRLLDSRWWDLKPEQLDKINFNNIELALDQIEELQTPNKNLQVNLLLSQHSNYALVEDQLHSLIEDGLLKDETIRSKEQIKNYLNLSYFIRDKADVLLSHGVADKNYFWISDENKKRFVNSLDGLLVQGEWMKRRLINSESIKLDASQIFTVGWPRLDYLRELQAKAPAIPVAEKIKICWAPTHDARKRGDNSKSTSSYPDFINDAEKLAKKYNVEIALHPRNSEDKKPTQEKLLESNIVVSDFGTLVYEAWTLGKPVIFPRWILKDNIQKYLKNSAEAYIMENRIGYHADSLEEMITIIESNPHITPDVDEFMLDYLYNYKSSGSVAMIADALRKLYQVKFNL